NESTPNPLGKSTSTLTVVSFSSSVGTAIVKICPCAFTTVGGLTLAWPKADAGSASAPTRTSAPAARQVMLAMVVCSCWEGDAAGSAAGLVSAGGRRAAGAAAAVRGRDQRQRGASGDRGGGEHE